MKLYRAIDITIDVMNQRGKIAGGELASNTDSPDYDFLTTIVSEI